MRRRGPVEALTFGEGWAAIEDIGGREAMEDRFVVGDIAVRSAKFQVYGVFDGHNGAEVSSFCEDKLVRHVRDALSTSTSPSTVASALAAALLALDEHGKRTVKRTNVGSTACVALLTSDDVWIGNVGDSRAILRTVTGHVRQMSEDHKPALASETKRILDNGGFLTNTYGMIRIMGGLNLSRSIGDWHMRPFVVATPDVRIHRGRGTAGTNKRDQREYLVIATDGLWDVFENEQVTAVIDAHPHTRAGVGAALTALVKDSRRRGSSDNVTILYVGLALRRPAVPAAHKTSR